VLQIRRPSLVLCRFDFSFFLFFLLMDATLPKWRVGSRMIRRYTQSLDTCRAKEV